MKQNRKDKIRAGISIGDFNGIGMEVIIKTLMDNRVLEFCTPIVYGSSRIASYHRKALGVQDFSFNIITEASQAQPRQANLINLWDEEVKIELGRNTVTAGKYAMASLQAAVEDLASLKIDVLVTAPINKHNMQEAGFPFQGHTEYLTDYSNEDHSLMLMIGDQMRVGLVTVHEPLSKVCGMITETLIMDKLKVFNRSLIIDFGIEKPKIAVLGLNPHAGDQGTIGSEEKEIISPAIEKALSANILAHGPYPADGFFGHGGYKAFDGALAMYHDQGLSAFKSMYFDSGVNYTAGLPIVRTSPVHGTAYEIAGKSKASAESFRHALFAACDIYKTRKEERELRSKTLPLS